MEQHRFEADVRQILELVTRSIYSDREVFLRELVSNAADALDRARFEALRRKDLLEPPGEPAIRITVDREARTLTVSDDGFGMTREEALENLGTIARSGTRKVAEELGEARSAEALVGRFGVGFYSAFMVADRVVVESRSALPGAEPVRWESDGGDDFRVGPGSREQRGTDVVLHLRDDAEEFLDPERLRGIVRRHSDYVAWPILVEGERANQEVALWNRDPRELADEDYERFYRHLTGETEPPILRTHARVEGRLSWRAVLFVPARRRWEADRLDFRVGVQLYQKRVKVLDSTEELFPRWLRFLVGVVDCPDVDLNVSREMLQRTPVIRELRRQLTKRVLRRFKEVSVQDPETWERFWKEYGHILKEGVADDDLGDQRELFVSLLRWRTTTSDGALRSLADVRASMADGQDAIWYLAHVDRERIERAPVLEAFRRKGWEVLLMDDPVDEFVVARLREHDGVPLRSVLSGEAPEALSGGDDPIAREARSRAEPLVAWMREVFRGELADVRLSRRLTDSPSVLVDQEGALPSNLVRILRAANQDVAEARRVLEVHPEHPLVQRLAALRERGTEGLEPFARLLLDHARIAEGRLEDPEGFTRRLQALMEKAAEAMGAGGGTAGEAEGGDGAEAEGGDQSQVTREGAGTSAEIQEPSTEVESGSPSA